MNYNVGDIVILLGTCNNGLSSWADFKNTYAKHGHTIYPDGMAITQVKGDKIRIQGGWVFHVNDVIPAKKPNRKGEPHV